jgi:hypothetical protein
MKKLLPAILLVLCTSCKERSSENSKFDKLISSIPGNKLHNNEWIYNESVDKFDGHVTYSVVNYFQDKEFNDIYIKSALICDNGVGTINFDVEDSSDTPYGIVPEVKVSSDAASWTINHYRYVDNGYMFTAFTSMTNDGAFSQVKNKEFVNAYGDAYDFFANYQSSFKQVFNPGVVKFEVDTDDKKLVFSMDMKNPSVIKVLDKCGAEFNFMPRKKKVKSKNISDMLVDMAKGAGEKSHQ